MAGDHAYASGIEYDPAGRMTQLLRGSVATSYAFYDWDEQKYIDYEWIGQGGRLAGMVSTGLQNLSYTYDHGGNILSIVDSEAGETLSFAYDDLNQLSAVSGAYSESYGYVASLTAVFERASKTAIFNGGQAGNLQRAGDLPGGQPYPAACRYASRQQHLQL